MRPLTVAALAAFQALWLRVSKGSLIKVDHNHYSVPTSLIGYMVSVHVYEWHLEVYYGRQLVGDAAPPAGPTSASTSTTATSSTACCASPAAFGTIVTGRRSFPCLVFRQAWERLNTWYAPRQADLIYLRILRLAAQTLESEVAAALQVLLERQVHFTESDVAALLNLQAPPAPQIARGEVCLKQYDQLLLSTAAGREVCSCRSLSHPPALQSLAPAHHRRCFRRNDRPGRTRVLAAGHLPAATAWSRKWPAARNAASSACSRKPICPKARPWPASIRAGCLCASGA